MRQDATDAQSNWEKHHNDMVRRHRKFGVAVVLTGLFLLAIGLAVAK